jgi:hypothetical protein
VAPRRLTPRWISTLHRQLRELRRNHRRDLAHRGLVARFAAIAFIVEMFVAILSTKITLYLGTSPLPLPPAPPAVGI